MSEEIVSILAPESGGETLETEVITADVNQSTEVGGESNEEKELSPEELKAERERLLKELELEREEKAKLEHGYKTRINKEVAKRKASEAQLKAQALAIDEQKPKREAYASDEEYYQAVGAFEYQKSGQLKQIQAEMQELQAQALSGYDEAYKRFETLIPDHNAVVSSFAQREGIPADLRSFVEDSDYGPLIMVHLAKTPQDWAHFKNSPPSLRGGMLKAIEGFYAKELEKRSAPKPVSQAPEPIKAKGSAPISDLSNLRGQDYADKRRQQRQQNRSR